MPLSSVHACAVTSNQSVIHSINKVTQRFAARRCHSSVNITLSWCLQGLSRRKMLLGSQNIISDFLSYKDRREEKVSVHWDDVALTGPMEDSISSIIAFPFLLACISLYFVPSVARKLSATAVSRPLLPFTTELRSVYWSDIRTNRSANILKHLVKSHARCDKSNNVESTDESAHFCYFIHN